MTDNLVNSSNIVAITQKVLKSPDLKLQAPYMLTVLSKASSEFYEALKVDEKECMVEHYCKFVYDLIVCQVQLSKYAYVDKLDIYLKDSQFVNAMTNQGFILLELLFKTVPISAVELEQCFTLWCNYYLKKSDLDYMQISKAVNEIIYGSKKSNS